MRSPDRNDALAHILGQLHVPPPRPQAQADLLRAARQMRPRRTGLSAKLRWLQAFLAVPQTRLVVMATLLACVITIGLIGQSQRNLPSIPPELLLYDIAISEPDGTLGEEWIAGDLI